MGPRQVRFFKFSSQSTAKACVFIYDQICLVSLIITMFRGGDGISVVVALAGTWYSQEVESHEDHRHAGTWLRVRALCVVNAHTGERRIDVKMYFYCNWWVVRPCCLQCTTPIANGHLISITKHYFIFVIDDMTIIVIEISTCPTPVGRTIEFDPKWWPVTDSPP